MRRNFLMLGCVAFSTWAYIEAYAQESYTVLGPGAISCGQFLKDSERLQGGSLFGWKVF
jgi:hypothetical protein